MRTIESAAVIYNASTGTWPTILSSTGVSQDQTPNKEFSTKYLNGMPLPPTGKFIIQGYNNVRYTYEFKNQKCYGYYNYGDNTNSQTTRKYNAGRVTCDKKTIDDFLNGRAGVMANGSTYKDGGPIAHDP